MPIYTLEELTPQIAPGAWLAPSAEVMGDVIIHDKASIWFCCVLRGDRDRITIGMGSNVQDNSVLHCDPGAPVVVGENVTIGHQVMLHGCRIGDGSLIGIGSVILNHARIGKNCLVGAGSLITEGKEFPDGSLIIGRPAKVVRTLTEEDFARMRRNSANYVSNAQRYRKRLQLL